MCTAWAQALFAPRNIKMTIYVHLQTFFYALAAAVCSCPLPLPLPLLLPLPLPCCCMCHDDDDEMAGRQAASRRKRTDRRKCADNAALFWRCAAPLTYRISSLSLSLTHSPLLSRTLAQILHGTQDLSASAGTKIAANTLEQAERVGAGEAGR